MVRCRWWIILLTLPLVGLAAAGIPRIRISSDTRVFFAEDNPDYQALKAFERTYSREQSVFFVVAPRDGNVFTRATLTAVAELTSAGWQVPHSSVVNSLTNFPITRAEGDELIVEDLAPDPGGLSEPELERIRRTALSESALVDVLLSRTGHVTGVHIGFAMPEERDSAIPEIVEHVRRMEKDFRARHPDIDLSVTGSVMIDDAFAHASKQDLMT